MQGRSTDSFLRVVSLSRLFIPVVIIIIVLVIVAGPA
jgi:hypothetical protein